MMRLIIILLLVQLAFYYAQADNLLNVKNQVQEVKNKINEAKAAINDRKDWSFTSTDSITRKVSAVSAAVTRIRSFNQAESRLREADDVLESLVNLENSGVTLRSFVNDASIFELFKENIMLQMDNVYGFADIYLSYVEMQTEEWTNMEKCVQGPYVVKVIYDPHLASDVQNTCIDDEIIFSHLTNKDGAMRAFENYNTTTGTFNRYRQFLNRRALQHCQNNVPIPAELANSVIYLFGYNSLGSIDICRSKPLSSE